MRSAAARPRPSRPQAFPCLFGIGYGTIERLLIAGASTRSTAFEFYTRKNLRLLLNHFGFVHHVPKLLRELRFGAGGFGRCGSMVSSNASCRTPNSD
jgi:hypothetical protein